MAAALIPGAKKRRIAFVLGAAFGAGALSSTVLLIFNSLEGWRGWQGLEDLLIIVISSVLAAIFFAWIFWTRMMRKGESKDGGADAGRNTGFCAIPFATTPYLIFAFYHEFIESPGPGSPYFFQDVVTALLFIVYGIMFAFFFGGFLAPIIGQYVGQYIAKDPDYAPALPDE